MFYVNIKSYDFVTNPASVGFTLGQKAQKSGKGFSIMKTRIVLFTIIFVSVFFVSFGFADTVAGPAVTDDAQWAFEFGRQVAAYGIEPMKALRVVSQMRTLDPYRGPDDQSPATDTGSSFWSGFKSMNPCGLIVLGDRDVYQEEHTPSSFWRYSPEYRARRDNYQSLRHADLRGLDLNEVDWAFLDLTGVQFDYSLMRGEFYSCILDGSAWNGVTTIGIVITWSGEEWSRSYLRAANLGMEVWANNTLSIAHTDMQKSDLSGLQLGQKFNDNPDKDLAGLILRHCDVTDSIIPSAVYARATVRDCTGVVKADWEAGQKSAASTIIFEEVKKITPQ